MNKIGELSKDPFGNYVVALAIEMRSSEVIQGLFSKECDVRMPESFSEFCLNKYSSNVLDKIIESQSLKESHLE